MLACDFLILVRTHDKVEWQNAGKPVKPRRQNKDGCLTPGIKT